MSSFYRHYPICCPAKIYMKVALSHLSLYCINHRIISKISYNFNLLIPLIITSSLSILCIIFATLSLAADLGDCLVTLELCELFLFIFLNNSSFPLNSFIALVFPYIMGCYDKNSFSINYKRNY